MIDLNELADEYLRRYENTIFEEIDEGETLEEVITRDSQDIEGRISYILFEEYNLEDLINIIESRLSL